jgi:hypothetical protein
MAVSVEGPCRSGGSGKGDCYHTTRHVVLISQNFIQLEMGRCVRVHSQSLSLKVLNDCLLWLGCSSGLCGLTSDR